MHAHENNVIRQKKKKKKVYTSILFHNTRMRKHRFTSGETKNSVVL